MATNNFHIPASCSCVISLWVSDRLSDLLLTNCLCQKWWTTSEMTLQKHSVFRLAFSLALCDDGSPHLLSCFMETQVDRNGGKPPTNGPWGPKSNQQPPEWAWKWVLPRLYLEVTVALSDTLFTALWETPGQGTQLALSLVFLVSEIFLYYTI